MKKVIIIGFDFIKDIFNKRVTILELATRDFKKSYANSYLGVAWAFLQPLIQFTIIFLVFAFGLKGNRHTGSGIPFVAYFFTGQIAYSFIANMLNAAIASINEYAFLVKRVDFRLSILPIVKIISSFWVHYILVVILLVINFSSGVKPSLFWIQTIYYTFAAIMLALGLSWIFFSLQPFVKDTSRIVQIFIQIGFWVTPIFWNMKIVPKKIQFILKLNPAYYVVNGYRNSLLYHKYFWEEPVLSLYYWVLVGICLFIGMSVYTRLKPHFAEVI